MKSYRCIITVFVIVVLSFCCSIGFSQVTLGVDSVNCGATSTTIHSTLVGEVPTSSGITVDDEWSTGVFPIGFTFNFYGTNYTKCIIGGNGAICFDTTLAGSWFDYTISSALLGNSVLYNCVCGPYCDIDISGSGGGTITYSTVGTAPYRKFVVSFCRDYMFSCTTQWTTSQIILYETTNIVEVQIAHKTICAAWNGGYAIVGVQNAAGTAATAAPSRDFPTVWSATHEGWQFVPSTGFTSYAASSIPYASVPLASSPIYWYDSTTGAYLGSGPSFTVSPTAPTTYIAAALGCDDSTFAYVHVDLATLVTGGGGGTPVFADFTLEAHPGCVADTVFCFNSSTPPGATSIWTFGDGSPTDSVFTNPRHVYVVQGTYTVHLLYRNSSGCKDTISKSVSFNHSVSSVFTATPMSACLGSPVTFTNSSVGGGATYLWTFGDGTTSTSANPVHTYQLGGNYIVELTVTDTIPCMAKSNTSIQVVSIDAKAAPHDTTVCLKLPMPLSTVVHVAPDTFTSVTYQWTPATNLDDPTSAHPNFSGIGDYTYTFTATVNPLGCTATDVVTIHSKPPIALINVTPDQTIPLGSSVQLNSNGAWIYAWTPNDGTISDPNINNPIATPTDSVTTYTVIGMSMYGCKDTATVTIRVDPTEGYFIPAAFTPNGDGLNDIFRVVLKWQKLVDFQVVNRWGQEVFHTSDPKKGWDGTFLGEPQDMGVYYYHVVIANPEGGEKPISGNVTLVR